MGGGERGRCNRGGQSGRSPAPRGARASLPNSRESEPVAAAPAATYAGPACAPRAPCALLYPRGRRRGRRAASPRSAPRPAAAPRARRSPWWATAAASRQRGARCARCGGRRRGMGEGWVCCATRGRARGRCGAKAGCAPAGGARGAPRPHLGLGATLRAAAAFCPPRRVALSPPAAVEPLAAARLYIEPHRRGRVDGGGQEQRHVSKLPIVGAHRRAHVEHLRECVCGGILDWMSPPVGSRRPQQPAGARVRPQGAAAAAPRPRPAAREPSCRRRGSSARGRAPPPAAPCVLTAPPPPPARGAQPLTQCVGSTCCMPVAGMG